jgi:hypothetical protein
VRNARREAEKVKREALFYALVTKMRLIASREVITSAEQVMDGLRNAILRATRDGFGSCKQTIRPAIREDSVCAAEASSPAHSV